MRHTTTRFIASTVLAVLISSAAAAAVAQQPDNSPMAVVELTVGQVIEILKDDGLTEASKKRQVRTVISEHFDFTAMANRVLATNWRKASKAQRSKFTNLFRQLLSNTYWRKISGYTNETVEYLGERRRSDALATVNTVIKTSTVEIPVDYKLYLRGGERWMAYDVVIEQVSLVRNYRSSFQDIVREKGIDGLIGQLEIKVAESSIEDE